MWLIRLHKIQTKDYNYIKRVFEKLWFQPRKTAWIIFIKALFFHILQKKSWRNVWDLLDCNHIIIYNFFCSYKSNPEIKNIFKYFANRRIIVFIKKDVKYFSNDDLDKNEIFLNNTNFEIEKIFEDS